MSNKFRLYKNSYLNIETLGYYHQFYTGYQKPNNPDFLNVLKNTYDDADYSNLIIAKQKVFVLKIMVGTSPKGVLTSALFFCNTKAYEARMLYNKSVQALKKGCDLICLLLIIYNPSSILKGNLLPIPTGKIIH